MDEIINFYNFANTELSVAVIIFNILLSFILVFVIVLVYRKTHSELSYSQSFLVTMIMVGILASVVMMTVQNNLIGAFALLGAFSLIRFRTILKETRDIAFIFFSLVVGVAVGTNNYSIALATTFILSSIVFVLWRFKFEGISVDSLGYVLTIFTKDDVDANYLKNVISKYVTTSDILHSKYRRESGGHYAFSLNMKKEEDFGELEKELRRNDSIERFELITSKHSVGY